MQSLPEQRLKFHKPGRWVAAEVVHQIEHPTPPLGLISQAHNDQLGKTVDLAHKRDLRVPFRDVSLVDTHGVNPNAAFRIAGPDLLQCLDETGPDVDWISVAGDGTWVGFIGP